MNNIFVFLLLHIHLTFVIHDTFQEASPNQQNEIETNPAVPPTPMPPCTNLKSKDI